MFSKDCFGFKGQRAENLEVINGQRAYLSVDVMWIYVIEWNVGQHSVVLRRHLRALDVKCGAAEHVRSVPVFTRSHSQRSFLLSSVFFSSHISCLTYTIHMSLPPWIFHLNTYLPSAVLPLSYILSLPTQPPPLLSFSNPHSAIFSFFSYKVENSLWMRSKLLALLVQNQFSLSAAEMAAKRITH